jgi:hypothetical protein
MRGEYYSSNENTAGTLASKELAVAVVATIKFVSIPSANIKYYQVKPCTEHMKGRVLLKQ